MVSGLTQRPKAVPWLLGTLCKNTTPSSPVYLISRRYCDLHDINIFYRMCTLASVKQKTKRFWASYSICLMTRKFDHYTIYQTLPKDEYFHR